MWVVLGVIAGGVVLAAIIGALRAKPNDSPLWGNPKQALLLIVVLVVLAVAIVWAVHMNNLGSF